MAKKFHIRPTSLSFDSAKIRPTKIEEPQGISFNFKRLCEKQEEEKFVYKSRQASYFVTLLDRLREVSRMNIAEMTVQNRRSLRCHPIDFSQSSVSETSFGILGEDVDKDAWQFQLSSNEHGRVHGYFVENVFYVVWLDPNHELYPGEQ